MDKYFSKDHFILNKLISSNKYNIKLLDIFDSILPISNYKHSILKIYIGKINDKSTFIVLGDTVFRDVPKPNDYNTLAKFYEIAQKLSMPIISFIDIPGADASVFSENKGQVFALNKSINSGINKKIKKLSIIIGFACSGGAIALLANSKIYMLENTYLSVINPYSCMDILSVNKKTPQLLESMCFTPEKLLGLKLIDGIIKTCKNQRCKCIFKKIKLVIINFLKTC